MTPEERAAFHDRLLKAIRSCLVNTLLTTVWRDRRKDIETVRAFLAEPLEEKRANDQRV